MLMMLFKLFTLSKSPIFLEVMFLVKLVLVDAENFGV